MVTLIVIGLIFSFTISVVLFSVPKIIKVANLKHLFDDPAEDRKVHSCKTPNLGGIAIFTSLILSICLFIPFATTPYISFIIASSLILFTLGLKDDLVGLGPMVKFLAQILAALLVVYFANVRLTSFYGVFGIHEISKPLSILTSVFAILLIVNAFNLIDGIDLLAGSIGAFVSLFFGFVFYKMQQNSLCYLSFSLAGSLIGFMWYNRSPAKIFMGDTGSLLVGLIVSILSIRFIELNKFNSISNPNPFFSGAPAIVCGLLIIPLFDTLRVFTLRICKGKSPFHADRNHIHHRLLDFGLTHMQSTGILLLITIGFLSLTISLQNMGTVELIIFTSLLALTLNILSWHFFKTPRDLKLVKTFDLEMDSPFEFKIVPLEIKLKEMAANFDQNANSYKMVTSLLEEENESKQVVLP